MGKDGYQSLTEEDQLMESIHGPPRGEDEAGFSQSGSHDFDRPPATPKGGHGVGHEDIEDDEDLLNTAEGFIYTVYEIMKSSEPELSEIADEIFNIELIQTLEDKKYLLTEKLRASFAQKKIEVRDQSKEGIRILTPEDFAPLLESRTELVPLLGGIVTE